MGYRTTGVARCFYEKSIKCIKQTQNKKMPQNQSAILGVFGNIMLGIIILPSMTRHLDSPEAVTHHHAAIGRVLASFRRIMTGRSYATDIYKPGRHAHTRAKHAP
jgi:hypothetical protein